MGKTEFGRGVAIGTALRTPARGAPKHYIGRLARHVMPRATTSGQPLLGLLCRDSGAPTASRLRAPPHKNPTFRHVGPGPAYSLAINAGRRESSSLARTGWRRGKRRSGSRQVVNESGVVSCTRRESRTPPSLFWKF